MITTTTASRYIEHDRQRRYITVFYYQYKIISQKIPIIKLSGLLCSHRPNCFSGVIVSMLATSVGLSADLVKPKTINWYLLLLCKTCTFHLYVATFQQHLHMGYIDI
jgi:hypothetical protein